MVWRSLMFVPGSQERMLQRAPTAGADGLILDLEASVAPSEKDTATGRVAEALPTIAAASTGPVFVRLNPLGSGRTQAEIHAVVQPSLAGLVLPLAETVDGVRTVANWVTAAEASAGLADGSVRLLLILESALGVLKAYDLLTADGRVAAALFGAEDFRHDMGLVPTPGGQELAFARASVGLAARAARLPALDMVFTDLANEAGLVAEARAAAQLGYSGKQVIHPRQVAPVHQAFAPTAAEIAWAERVIAANAAQAAQGVGAFVLDGRMVDRPVVVQAERVLARAAGGPPAA